MRAMHDAIVVGIGTALNDDPQLNSKLAQRCMLVRSVNLCDSSSFDSRNGQTTYQITTSSRLGYTSAPSHGL